RPKCHRRSDLAVARQVIRKELDRPLRQVPRCDACAPVIEIGLERSHTQELVRPGRPSDIYGSRRDERRELDLGVIEICCLKASATDLASSGLIFASVPE